MTLAEYARQYVFEPLGMRESMFQPPPALGPRIAPTENLDGRLLRGVVHDESARYMGGIAGNAGLFTTAADLGRFAEMMLGLGYYNGVRVFSPLAIQKFSTPQSPPDQPILRGLGWDIDSPYSGNRGELFPIGFLRPHGIHRHFHSGSSPLSQTYVILLANSVHPRRRPPITALRGRVATLVAVAVGIQAPGVTLTGYNETLAGAGLHRVVARNASVLTGLDALAEERFAPLRPYRVGLITNQTGLDRNARPSAGSHARGGRTPGRPVLSRARTLRRRGPRGHR